MLYSEKLQRSEGYCKKCGAPLGLDGQCAACAMEQLGQVFICQVCGQPKVHSRLRGYHCHNERHNDQVRDGG